MASSPKTPVTTQRRLPDDILTQMQDELDMLLHQMYTSLHYIQENAPPAPITGQPILSSFNELEAQTQTQTQTTAPTPSAQLHPQAPSSGEIALPPQDAFAKDIRELSADLVVKEQQLEMLIKNLPGLNNTEAQQIQQMKDLERQLEEMEGERLEAVAEKERLVRKVEAAIGGVGGMR